MWQSFDDVSRYGRELADSGLESLASVSRGAQAIAAEATDYSRKSVEAGNLAFERLASAGSLEKAVEIQADYARQAYESFVAGTTRFGELYADMAKDAWKPYESLVGRGR